MKKIKEVLRRSVLIVSRYKVAKYILISALLLMPLSSYMLMQNIKNDKSNNKETQTITEELLTQGTINTDAEGDFSKEEPEMSSYILDDGFSEIDESEFLSSSDKSADSSQSSSASSSNNVATVDNSQIIGQDAVILEGSDFDPIKNLNIKALDVDGSDITSKVTFDSSNVDTETPGTYKIRAVVKLNTGSQIQRNFSVKVQESELDVKVKHFKAVDAGVERNGSIIFDLSLNVSKNKLSAQSVMINGEEYSVYKGKRSLVDILLKNQNYKVVVKADNILGRKDYELNYIKMNDNVLITTDNNTTVDILKTKAKVKNFSYKEQPSKDQIITDFNVEDVDDSVSNLRIELYLDDKNIYTKNVEKNQYNKIYLPTQGDGKYEIRIVGDEYLSTGLGEKYEQTNKTIYSELVKIKTKDNTSLKGNNIEIEKGYSFEPIKDLGLKATDADGEDISDKIVIEEMNVDTNVAGKYVVSAYIINQDNKKVNKKFTVTVKEAAEKSSSVESKNLPETNEKAVEKTSKMSEDYSVSRASFDEEVSTLSEEAENNNSSNSRLISRSSVSSSNTISGNESETLTALVDVVGNVHNADGIAPAGRIQVELPTRLTFAVDEDSQFKGTTFNIKNESSCEIEVSVSEFRSIGNAITVKPLNQSLESLDRSNVHLYLLGDRQVDLGTAITQDQKLIDIPAARTRVVQLLGGAGNGNGEKVDRDGTTDEFTLQFKINKKN